MNILLAVRALGALALPAVAAGGFLERRGRRGHEPVEEPPASSLPRPRRRDLQRLGASLEGLADFDLRGADLRGLPLEAADLSGLDLCHVRLRRTVLRNVRSDRTTQWPRGFVPVSDAARHP